MKTIWRFIKTTVTGGLLFLVPVVVLIVVLMQAFGLMLQVAEPLEDLFPIDNNWGCSSGQYYCCTVYSIDLFYRRPIRLKKDFQQFSGLY